KWDRRGLLGLLRAYVVPSLLTSFIVRLVLDSSQLILIRPGRSFQHSQIVGGIAHSMPVTLIGLHLEVCDQGLPLLFVVAHRLCPMLVNALALKTWDPAVLVR